MALALGPVIGQIGGGGGVEEIPVSMSGGGNGNVYPLTTVDAGDGAVIFVMGTLYSSNTNSSTRPHLQIGSTVDTYPQQVLLGPSYGIGETATGVVEISVLTRTFSATTFNGTVYVARL